MPFITTGRPECDVIDRQFSSRHRASEPRRQSGFSLIELLVVVVVVALLAAIAYPSLAGYVRQSRRADAQAALLDLNTRQEQFFLDNKTYTTSLGAGGLNVDLSGGRYAFTVDGANGACPIVSCYVLRAAPQGGQADDDCGDLTLDSAGDTSPTGCWD